MKEYILTVTEDELDLLIRCLNTGIRNPPASEALVTKLQEQSLQVVNRD